MSVLLRLSAAAAAAAATRTASPLRQLFAPTLLAAAAIIIAIIAATGTCASAGAPPYCFGGDLVLYYPMDEGAGTVLHDRSGFQNDLHADIVGAAEWGAAPGAAGKPALEFLSHSAVARSLPPASRADKIRNALLQSNAFTLEVWAAPHASSGGGGGGGPARIFTYSRNPSCNHVHMHLAQAGAALSLRLRHSQLPPGACGDTASADGTPFAPGVRRQYVARYNATHTSLYVDGAHVHSEDIRDWTVPGGAPRDLSGWQAGTMSVALGNEVTGGGKPAAWRGHLDSVALWRRALSDAEIARLAAAGGVRGSTCAAPVEPVVSCVVSRAPPPAAGGPPRCDVYWGYVNHALTPLGTRTIAPAPGQNDATPAAAVSPSLPAVFLPGRHDFAFASLDVPCPGQPPASAAWTLDGSTRHAALASGAVDERAQCAGDSRVQLPAADALQCPSGASGRLVADVSVGGWSATVGPLRLPPAVDPVTFYAHDTTRPGSTDAWIVQHYRAALRDRIWLALLEHRGALFLLVGADVPDDGTGGYLHLAVQQDRPSPGPHYFPLALVDDAQSDGWHWDAASGTATYDLQWQGCCTDGVVFGPILAGVGDCVRVTATSAGGVDALGARFVSVDPRNDTRAVLDVGDPDAADGAWRPGSAGTGAEIVICPQCSSAAPVPGDGNDDDNDDNDDNDADDRPCRWYDACGTCEGDGSTCPRHDGSDDCANGGCSDNVTTVERTDCAVALVDYGNSSTTSGGIAFTAVGSFVPGLTSVRVELGCPHGTPALAAQIAHGWHAHDETIPGAAGAVLRTYTQTLPLATVYECFGGGGGGAARGAMRIVSHYADTNGTRYDIPCAFDVETGAEGHAAVQYGVHGCDLRAGGVRTTWLAGPDGDAQRPRDLMLALETCVSRPHDDPVRLEAPRVAPGGAACGDGGGRNATHPPPPPPSSSDEEYALIVASGTDCDPAHALAPTHCCQTWTLVTTGGAALDCFGGHHALLFDIRSATPSGIGAGGDSGDDNDRDADSRPARVELYLDVCKPPAPRLPPVRVGDYGTRLTVYADAQLTRPARALYDRRRAYALIELVLPDDAPCDMYEIELLDVLLCVPTRAGGGGGGSGGSGDDPGVGCRDPDATGYSLLHGAIFAAQTAPVPGREHCISALRFSWISRAVAGSAAPGTSVEVRTRRHLRLAPGPLALQSPAAAIPSAAVRPRRGVPLAPQWAAMRLRKPQWAVAGPQGARQYLQQHRHRHISAHDRHDGHGIRAPRAYVHLAEPQDWGTLDDDPDSGCKDNEEEEDEPPCDACTVHLRVLCGPGETYSVPHGACVQIPPPDAPYPPGGDGWLMRWCVVALGIVAASAIGAHCLGCCAAAHHYHEHRHVHHHGSGDRGGGGGSSRRAGPPERATLGAQVARPIARRIHAGGPSIWERRMKRPNLPTLT